ncbi:hypothetical protein BS17DRAFT_779099 [Gyrodon lividus]|nr:hypothetical protein BS17DRAFT_779099 [Gyrodon lividus]
MSGPQPGVYSIVSAEAPNVSIGPDYNPEVDERVVVSDGEAQEWAVEEEDAGKYRLTVAYAQFTYENGDHNVVVRDERRGLIWRLREYGDEEYTIERDSDIRPNAGWTLTSPKSKSPVELRLIGDFPVPNQLWKFVPSRVQAAQPE